MAQKKKQKETANREMWIAFAIFTVILVAIIALIIFSRHQSENTAQATTETTISIDQAPTSPYEIEGFETVAGAELGKLNDSLSLTCVGRYSGAFVEDGTDEAVTDVLAILVENIGTQIIEYAEVKINCDGEDAFFELSALPGGTSALIMETDRMQYVEDMEFSRPICLNFAAVTSLARTDFSQDFQVTAYEGVINITNVSGHAFDKPVKLCYKTELQNGLFLGGIAYWVTWEKDITAGKTEQILTSHYTGQSQILYMSYDE